MSSGHVITGSSISIAPASTVASSSPLISVNTSVIPVAGSTSLSISSAAASIAAKARPVGVAGSSNVTL